MKTIFTKDQVNKKMFVTREFAASLEKTWRAWTEPALLDQWWAPKPWKAETKTMDFKEGGKWHYCMVGPAGEKHWGIVKYTKVIVYKLFAGTDAFCDENEIVNNAMPGTDWKIEFHKTNTGTEVRVEMTFSTEQTMQTMIDMGFQQGFSMAHDNLDELLKK